MGNGSAKPLNTDANWDAFLNHIREINYFIT